MKRSWISTNPSRTRNGESPNFSSNRLWRWRTSLMTACRGRWSCHHSSFYSSRTSGGEGARNHRRCQLRFPLMPSQDLCLLLSQTLFYNLSDSFTSLHTALAFQCAFCEWMGRVFVSFDGDLGVGLMLCVIDRSDPLNRVRVKCVWHISLCSVSEHVLMY